MLHSKSVSPSARWLKRLRRELSGSGRVTQCALQLARDGGATATQWEQDLRAILSGDRSPDADCILRIEQLIARPRPEPAGNQQGLLAF